MNRNYIAFIVGYDWHERLERLGLACDESFALGLEIADRFYVYCKENGLEEMYEVLYRFVEGLDFEDVWATTEIWVDTGREA